MLHKLALSASVLALAGGLAVAPSGRAMAATSSLATAHWLASDIYKADVYDNAEDKIGVVTDLIIDNGGTVATAVVGIVVSHVSTALFVVASGLLVAQVALAALKWPRATLVVVVLSPILDRYLVPGLLPPTAEQLAHLLSEALLGGVGAVLVVQGARRGTLRAAMSHPTVWLSLGFIALAALSGVVNRVPPVQALAGIVFTMDAVGLFVLVRLVGFGTRQALIAISVLLGLFVAGALVAVAQAVLTPRLFGLSALQGRFGELYRLASFFGDPNSFAAFLSAGIPFAMFGATGLWTVRGRRVALAVAFLLILALWLSFSRGGWLGAFGGFTIAALILDRRALRIGVVVAVLALAVALVLPRDLLGVTGEQRPDLLGSTFGRVGTVGTGGDLRTLFVTNAVPILRDHPLLGVGPGRYGGAAADIFGTPVYSAYGTNRLFADPKQRTVDDFWLHLAVEAGILGLLAFVGMILAALRPIVRSARTATSWRRVVLAGISGAVICLTINSLTTMLLEANSVAYLFWFLLGLGSLLAVAPDLEPIATVGSASPPLELAADGDLHQGAEDEAQVEPEGAPIDVREVERHPLVEADPSPGRRLPEPGQARNDGEPAQVPRFVYIHLVRDRRSRADQAHLPAHDVEELRQLVEVRTA